MSLIHYNIVKEKEQIVTYDEISSAMEDMRYYTESKDVFDWIISEDTLIIKGLKCQKAETAFGNRHWIAWFTSVVPIPDGPYKFCGLPGLIVSLYDIKKYWVFELASMEEINKMSNLISITVFLSILNPKQFFLKKKDIT